MLWIAIGCFIGALIVFNAMWVWKSRASRDPAKLERFLKYKTYMQIAYFLLFIASAVCFLLW